jgi:hypothetical protein
MGIAHLMSTRLKLLIVLDLLLLVAILLQWFTLAWLLNAVTIHRITRTFHDEHRFALF